MSENAKPARILPAPHITGFWDTEFSDYPDRVRVMMADGKSVEYIRAVEQPSPRFVESLKLIRMMKENTYGGYKAKHNKNDR